MKRNTLQHITGHTYAWSLFVLMLCLPQILLADSNVLLPKVQIANEMDSGAFELGRTVNVTYNGAAQCALLEELFTANGCTLAEGGATVTVTLVDEIPGAYDYELYGYENEAYTLRVTGDHIAITAVTNTGVIRAAQTLTQLAEGYEEKNSAIGSVEITDWPAFKLRGYMHDVGRSFIPADELVKQIELFSRFKVNTFHWHLTENQAWRFEVKAYPKLTSAASMTRHEGQYYTQEDCKKVMAAAKKHGVIVIPEIDMPGHSAAFERAMGFNMQSEDGKKVLKAALDEVVEVFADAPYIHIGGDEVSTTAAYLNEMIAYVESKGKKAGIWNPINSISQDNLNASLAQMWGTRGYVASGKANIDCRYNYTNHFDVFADLVGIYKSNIYYESKGNTTVAGAISACWNDRKVESVADIMAQNNIYANVIATAERAWMGGGKRYIDNCTNGGTNGGGGVMLPNSGDEYEEFADWERRFLFHKANALKDEPIPYVKQSNVRWRITDAFPNGGDVAKVFPPEELMNAEGIQPDTYTYNGTTYNTGMATGAGIYLSHTWGKSIINAYYEAPAYNQTAYAWTYVYSPETQTVGAQIEFQNYSRSEQDPVPAAGNWDLYGSNIWLNGSPIAAPSYQNTGVSISSKEVTLKNENFAARRPIAVQLKKGWNKVFLKLPYVNAGYRLDKWMFTFVLTDLDGVAAVDGLIYSPNQCLDDAAEQVAAKISEVKQGRAAYISTLPGFWPESAAASLDAKIAEIEASFSEEMTAEQRAAQLTELDKALQTMKSACTASNMNQPIATTATDTAYYRMYTPLRESRYPTSKGVGAEIIGEQTATDHATWMFVKRADNSYNIINAVDGSYISPASSNNTALLTSASDPSAGWTIKPADTAGYVIITSGSAQFNQTNSGHNYKVFNWGSGTNTSDTGCKYVFEEVEYTPEDLGGNEGSSDNTFYIAAHTKQSDGSYVDRYLYVSNGTLANSTSYDKGNTCYVWELVANGSDAYHIKNGAGKYLSYANKSLQVADAAYSFQFKNEAVHTGVGAQSLYNPTSTGGKYMVMAANGSGYNQNSTPINNGSWSSDFILVPAVSAQGLKSITVISNIALANPTFTWNNKDFDTTPCYLEKGETITNPTLTLKSHNAAYKFEGFYADAAHTTPLASTTIETLEESITLYAKFSLDIFSSNFGDKPLRIRMYRDNSYTAGISGNTNGATGTTQVSDLTAASELWYITGTADACKIYNKATGNGYCLKVSGTSDGSAATMAQSGTTWKIVTKDGGYAIVPSNATGMSINAYGGKGGPLKLYNAGDQGGWWIFDMVSENTLTLSVNVDGEAWEATPRVAEMNMTINGVSSSTRISQSVDKQTYYLPAGASTFSLSSMTYRGYTFIGFEEDGRLVDTYTNAHVTENLTINALYRTNNERTLYYTPTNGKPYRIPAIATAHNGDIFAISDYRPCGNDIGYGEVDIMCRISKDNGASWSDEFFVANGKGGDTNAMTTGYGDAAIVADRNQNKLLVMMVCGRTVCHNGRWDKSKIGNKTADAINRVARVYATYNETTQQWDWTQPEEVTDHIYSLFLNGETPTVTSMFIGSGKICQSRVVKKGNYFRLYCSMWTRDGGNRVIYSDDFGGSWNVLGSINDRPAPSGDEPKVEELPDGTIVLSSRKGGGRYFNLFTFKDNTYTSGKWGTAVASNEVSNGLSFGGNSTNGEIYRVPVIRINDGVKCDIMLQSIPTGSGRTDVTIFYKEMEYKADGTNKYTPTTISQGWTKGKHVSTKGSCYSTMILQADGRIAFLFEEEPGSYCIVYIPYTIEEITGGAYMIDAEATDIDPTHSSTDHSQSSAIYDLLGRRVHKASQGIYIIDGKKVIH